MMVRQLHAVALKVFIFTAVFAFLGAFTGTLNKNAFAAGDTSTTEIQSVVKGWSAKKMLLGKAVYNNSDQKIGDVEDIIITTDKHVSYAIIGVGGFLGVGERYVAIPAKDLKISDKKIFLPHATKEELKQMPKFDYRKK